LSFAKSACPSQKLRLPHECALLDRFDVSLFFRRQVSACLIVFKVFPVDTVPVPQNVLGGLIVREGFDDLLRGPLGSGMVGHIEVNDLAPVVKENDEAIQIAEVDRRDGEKINARNLLRVVGEKGLPGL
jgi:hypothetical protein